jgi:outer membrane protein TolC
MGRYPQPLTRDSNTLNRALPLVVNAGLPADMITGRPDLQQAELELEATKFDVNAARAAALPSLSVTPYLGLNAFKGSLLLTGASVTYGFLAGLTAPIFNKNEIRANYHFTGAAQKEAFYRYQQSMINGFNEVYTGLAGIDNRRNLQKLKELEVNELQHGVTTANDLYVAGYASYLEVITAQKSVLQAEFELNDTRKDVWIALVHLYRALGGGWR